MKFYFLFFSFFVVIFFFVVSSFELNMKVLPHYKDLNNKKIKMTKKNSADIECIGFLKSMVLLLFFELLF
jgi:hypothetical protein